MKMIFGGFADIRQINKNSDNKIGAAVATNQFMRALFTYGSFDEYHLFTTASLLQDAQQDKDISLHFLPNFERVKFIPLTQMLQFMQNTNYSVIHQYSGPFLKHPLYLRGLFPTQTFAATSVTYSLSYQNMFNDLITEMFLFPSEPFYSIVCISQAGLVALKRIMNTIIERTPVLEKFHLPRFDCIPLGIFTEIFHPRNKKDSRIQLGLPLDSIIILGIGRFSAADKMDLYPLILAFKKVLSKVDNDNVFLVLAGNNNYNNYAGMVKDFACSIGVGNKTIILGDIDDLTKSILYSAADVFVSPSDNIQETLGITVLEAMSSGLPIVASDWNGYKESIIHGKTGFKVPTYWIQCDNDISMFAPVSNIFGWYLDHLYLSQSISVDISKMVEYLTLLVKNNELREELSLNARKHAVDNYDWKMIIKAYEQLWAELSEVSSGGISSNYDIFTPKYFDTFKHYATKILDEETKLRRTQYGTDVLEEKAFCDIYREMQFRLSFDVLRGILSISPQFIELSELQKNISYNHSISIESTRYHIMWLLKYDLMELSIDN